MPNRLLSALTLACFPCVGALANGTAERLYVLVSPLRTAGPSSIVAFDIAVDGIPVQAESYPTGGIGNGSTSPQPLAVDASGSFLFAAHNEVSSLVVFRIDAAGGLTPVPSSPLPLTAPPVALATHTELARLYVPEFFGMVRVYEGHDDGTWDLFQEFDAAPYLRGVAVHPSGGFLYLVTGVPGSSSIRGYSIDEAGALTELTSSPLSVKDSRLWDLVVSSDGSFLFAHDLDFGIYSFGIDPAGALTPTAGSPFDVGPFSEELALTHDDRFLYSTAPFAAAVYGFAAAADGSLLAIPGSPFAGDHTSSGLLPSALGPRFYFIGRDTRRITTFAIDPDGRLFDHGPQVDIVDPMQRHPLGSLLLGLSLEVDLDIKPGSRTNAINPRASGLIPIVILGRLDLDVTQIDTASLRFGPGAAPPEHNGHLDHVNDDDKPDLVLHFRTGAAAIACGDTEVSLSGEMVDGRQLRGRDTIVTRGCQLVR